MSRVNLSSPILTTLFCCGCPLYFNVSIPLPRRYIVGYYNVKTILLLAQIFYDFIQYE